MRFVPDTPLTAPARQRASHSHVLRSCALRGRLQVSAQTPPAGEVPLAGGSCACCSGAALVVQGLARGCAQRHHFDDLRRRPCHDRGASPSSSAPSRAWW
jgi:hypothetical protein